MASSPSFAQQVDVLYNVLYNVAVHEVPPLQTIVDHEISKLISVPLPETADAQVSMFKALAQLQDTHSDLGWHHQGLYERLDNLGAHIVRRLVSKGPNDALKLWEDIKVLQILPLIKSRSSLDSSNYALLNTRVRQMVDDVKAILRQPVNGTTDERLLLLSCVARLRNFYQQWLLIDDELNKLIQKYAAVVGFTFEDATVDSAITATPVVTEIKEEEEPSSSPDPLINDVKKEESDPSPKPLANLLVVKQDQPSPQSSLQLLFAERAAREAAREQTLKLTEREDMRAKALARKDAIAKDPTKAEQLKYAEEMKAKIAKEAVAKQNILATIEADKLARQEKAEMTRMRRLADREARMEQEKVKKMKESEVEAKLSAMDQDMEFEDEDVEDVEEENEDGEDVIDVEEGDEQT